VQALKDSREQLLEIVDRWGVARQIETVFEEATRRAKKMPEQESSALLARLNRARALLGGVDPLRHPDRSQSPEDRIQELDEDDEEKPSHKLRSRMQQQARCSIPRKFAE
jgi:hypothetical protein